MKFLWFAMSDVAKTGEVAQAADNVLANLPAGIKVLTQYACLGIPFPQWPPNTVVAVSVVEAESAEALTASTWPLELAGATAWFVPVLELPIGGAAQVEKKMRG